MIILYVYIDTDLTVNSLLDKAKEIDHYEAISRELGFYNKKISRNIPYFTAGSVITVPGTLQYKEDNKIQVSVPGNTIEYDRESALGSYYFTMLLNA